MPIDFIADEEESPDSGIDFTPDPAPVFAQAPQPIIAPDASLIAQSEKKADLFAAQQKARQQGAYWEGVANRIGHVAQIINPWASTSENPLGGIGSALSGAGRIVAPVTEAAGNTAVGLVNDISQGGIQRGSFPNVSAALNAQHVGQVDESSPLAARIGEGAVRGAGQMVPATAAMAAGVPAPVAFGGQMGLTEMANSGDIGKALVQTAVGAGLGKVAEIGTTGGGLLASRVAARVPAALEKPIVAAGEFAGRQALQNVLMTAGNLPEIVKAYQENPAKGAAMLAEQIGVNLAFEAAHLPKTIRESIAKDQAETWLKDPQYLNRVDAETTRQAQAMRAPVIMPESLRELAKEPSTTGEPNAIQERSTETPNGRMPEQPVEDAQLPTEKGGGEVPSGAVPPGNAPGAAGAKEARTGEVPLTANEVTIKARTPSGEEINLKMDAGEAQRRFTQRKTVLEALRDCMG